MYAEHRAPFHLVESGSAGAAEAASGRDVAAGPAPSGWLGGAPAAGGLSTTAVCLAPPAAVADCPAGPAPGVSLLRRGSSAPCRGNVCRRFLAPTRALGARMGVPASPEGRRIPVPSATVAGASPAAVGALSTGVLGLCGMGCTNTRGVSQPHQCGSPAPTKTVGGGCGSAPGDEATGACCSDRTAGSRGGDPLCTHRGVPASWVDPTPAQGEGADATA